MSNKNNDGGTGFPTIREYVHGEGAGIKLVPGMTLRQWYAGMAMQGICTSTEHGWVNGTDAQDVAERAFKIADGMIAHEQPTEQKEKDHQ